MTRALYFYSASSFLDGDVYEGMTISESGWDIVWLLCRDGRLEHVFSEGLGHVSLVRREASGTCFLGFGRARGRMVTPETLVAIQPLAANIRVSGPNIQVLETGRGLIYLQEGFFHLAVTEFVNCWNCGGEGGWMELHGLAWSVDAPPAARFFILYRNPGSNLMPLRLSPQLPGPLPARNSELCAGWEMKPW